MNKILIVFKITIILKRKLEKMEAKRNQAMDKKLELQKKKMEKDLKMKMMKNPSMHPGFIYPESKKTKDILKVK